MGIWIEGKWGCRWNKYWVFGVKILKMGIWFLESIEN